MVGLPEQLTKDKRTQYFYSYNNWDESISEFWCEALKKWCLQNEQISFSFRTIFQDYTIEVKGFPGLLIPETLPVAFEETLLLESSSSSSSTFSRQPLEYKLDMNYLTNKALMSSSSSLLLLSSSFNQVIDKLVTSPINSIFNNFIKDKDWKSAKSRQLQLDKETVIVCTSILEDLAKMLAFYMSTKSSKDRTIFFRKPSGYKTTRTLSQMLKNSSNEGSMDIRLSRLLKCIANRLDNAISDEGERLVDMLCKLQLIQIGYEKFNNFANLSNNSKCWYIRFTGDIHTHVNNSNKDDNHIYNKNDFIVSPAHVAELNLLVNIDHNSSNLHEKQLLKNTLYKKIIQLYGTEDDSKWSDVARLDIIKLNDDIKRQMKKNQIFLSLPEHHTVLEQLKEDELFAQELILQKIAIEDVMKGLSESNNSNSSSSLLTSDKLYNTIDSIAEHRLELEAALKDNDTAVDAVNIDIINNNHSTLNNYLNMNNDEMNSSNSNIDYETASYFRLKQSIQKDIQSPTSHTTTMNNMNITDRNTNNNFPIQSDSRNSFKKEEKEKKINVNVNLKMNYEDYDDAHAMTYTADVDESRRRLSSNSRLGFCGGSTSRITPSRPVSDSFFNFESMSEELSQVSIKQQQQQQQQQPQQKSNTKNNSNNTNINNEESEEEKNMKRAILNS